MSEVTYDLKHPFKYAYKGEQQEASFITLLPPTFKQVTEVTPIKQAFTNALSEIQESNVVQDSSETQQDGDESEVVRIEPVEVMRIMYVWSGDLSKVFLHAEQLFKSGVALVDGETKLTSPLVQKMNLIDFERLVGAYISNFIVPSLMDGQ